MAGHHVFGNLKRHIIGTCAAMAGWAAFTVAPNTLGVKYAKDYLQKHLPYCKSISAEPKTEAILDEVIRDINATRSSPVKKGNIEFLQTNHLYPHPVTHKGIASYAAIIGLPIGTRCNADEVFHYHCQDDNSEHIATFCLLSKEAKKFLFARQIFYVEDSYVHFRCMFGLGLIALGSYLQYALNSTLDVSKTIQLMKFDAKGRKIALEDYIQILKAKALRQRLYSFVALSLLFVQAYRFIVATYSWTLEEKADKKVAQLGQEYIKGGKEYYFKVLECNLYTYNQFGTDTGVTRAGNIFQGKYPILYKSVPFTERYKFFASLSPEGSEMKT